MTRMTRIDRKNSGQTIVPACGCNSCYLCDSWFKTMNAQASVQQGMPISQRNRLVLRRLTQIVVSIMIQGTILFATSGHLDWVMAWVYIGVSVGFVMFNSAMLLSRDPGLIAERAQMKKDAKSWDKVLATLIVAVMPYRNQEEE